MDVSFNWIEMLYAVLDLSIIGIVSIYIFNKMSFLLYALFVYL